LLPGRARLIPAGDEGGIATTEIAGRHRDRSD
jgi:hypothetical protein